MRSSRSSLGEGRRVKSGEKVRDGERVKDKPNADGGFLEAEVRGSTWLALVPRATECFCASRVEIAFDRPSAPVNRGSTSVDLGAFRPRNREIEPKTLKPKPKSAFSEEGFAFIHRLVRGAHFARRGRALRDAHARAFGVPPSESPENTRRERPVVLPTRPPTRALRITRKEHAARSARIKHSRRRFARDRCDALRSVSVMMSACSRAHVVAAGRPLSTRAQSPRARSTRRVARASPARGSDVARRSASASALEGDAPAAQMPRDPVPELSNTSSPYDDAYVTLTRGQLVRKDVVTRTGGTRLGNVSQLWVDTDEWEVVALDCRPVANGVLSPVVNAVGGGAVDHVLMSSLRQVGDVVLVHDENAVERRWSSYGLSTIVGCDVVTERGTYIGRVRDFEFDPEDGLVQRLIVDALGLPVVPEEVVSTYAIDVSEILSSGADRIIVAEGAEARVEQLSSSLLQRLQLAAPPWEDDLADYGDYYARDYARDYEAFESDQRERRRYYDDAYDAFERRRAYAEESRESARRPSRDDASRGVPLVRPNEPFERRDADGGYGDRPQQPRQRERRERDYADDARPLDEWVVEEQMQYEYEMEGAGESRERYAAGRKSVASPPPPPPEAWGRAAPPPRDARARWDQAGGSGSSKGFDASEDML